MDPASSRLERAAPPSPYDPRVPVRAGRDYPGHCSACGVHDPRARREGAYWFSSCCAEPGCLGNGLMRWSDSAGAFEACCAGVAQEVSAGRGCDGLRRVALW